jgi:hypothetical protein
VEVLPIDANVEAYDALLAPGPLAKLRDRLEKRLSRLEHKPELDHISQRAYLQMWNARGDAQAAPAGIGEAVAVLRDRERFFDPQSYARAIATMESALRLISAAYAPLDLSFSGYRTPFALTTMKEIGDDASPERNPFYHYIESLAERLRAAAPAVIGISICFPGQLTPAYGFALHLKRLLPQVHFTVGGPALTQLFLKLRDVALSAALGPFDSAVMFEGEHTLHRLLGALDTGDDLSQLENVVVRDRSGAASYRPGHASEDLRTLPAPDFDGLPLDRYFSPFLTLPYDPTRGCYWGKCTFCHYGLAEVGTASYRERTVETALDHLAALAERHCTRYFYLSQDSVAPKTLVKLAKGMADRGMTLRWATDLKPENYLTEERAAVLRRGGAVACALGVESAAPRVLTLIDKGAPNSTVRNTIGHLAAADIAVEAMCFTDFPTETASEAMATLRFIEEHGEEIALYIIGEFDLTDGALVAKHPEQFGLKEIYRLDGDELGTGLFYDEAKPAKRASDHGRIDEALSRLGRNWWLHRYPWAGSLSTAHTVFYYDRFGPGAFRELARRPLDAAPFGARAFSALARYDLDEVRRSDDREQQLWHHLVREKRHVSRAAYRALADALPKIRPKPKRYRITGAEIVSSGKRPSNRPRSSA